MHNSETSLFNYIPAILPFELISRGFMSFRNTLHSFNLRHADLAGGCRRRRYIPPSLVGIT